MRHQAWCDSIRDSGSARSSRTPAEKVRPREIATSQVIVKWNNYGQACTEPLVGHCGAQDVELKQLIAMKAAECRRRWRNVCAPKSLSEAARLIGGGERVGRLPH